MTKAGDFTAPCLLLYIKHNKMETNPCYIFLKCPSDFIINSLLSIRAR